MILEKKYIFDINQKSCDSNQHTMVMVNLIYILNPFRMLIYEALTVGWFFSFCILYFVHNDLENDIAKKYEPLEHNTQTQSPSMQSFKDMHTNGRLRPELILMIRNALNMINRTNYEIYSH